MRIWLKVIALLVGVSHLARASDNSGVSGAGFVGVLLSRQEVQLRAEIPARIVSVHAELGRPVLRGETLAVLDSRDLKLKLVDAMSALETAKANVIASARESLDAGSRFRARKAIPDAWSKEDLAKVSLDLEHARAAMQAAQSNVVSAKAVVSAIRLQLETTRIVAPFDGWIAGRYKNIGDLVSLHDPIVTVIGVGPLLVRFALPPEVAASLGPQHIVQINTQEPGPLLRATVQSVAPTVDAASGMIIVEALLSTSTDARHAIYAGDVVRVTL